MTGVVKGETYVPFLFTTNPNKSYFVVTTSRTVASPLIVTAG